MNEPTRLYINISILAPLGVTVLQAAAELVRGGTPPPGYYLVSLSLNQQHDHCMQRAVPAPAPAEALAGDVQSGDIPPADLPASGESSKSQVKRVRAQRVATPAAAPPPAEAPEAPEAAPPPPAEAPAPAPVPQGPPPPSIEALRAAVKELIDAGRGAKVKAILTDIAAASVSDVPEAQRSDVLKSLQLARLE